MTSVATSNWELVFWEHAGRAHAAVRGPETSASSAGVPDESGEQHSAPADVLASALRDFARAR
jgi:hypothetical protein